LPAKPVNLISAKNWPARRPDGQTANAQSDPVPSVKGSSQRPGTERIEARVPTQIGQKFKFLCALNHLEQKDVITDLINQWNHAMTGRPDGQTALSQDLDDPRSDRLIHDDEEKKFLTSSSDHPMGRPDGQESPDDQKRREILAYYELLIGNSIKQNDRDFVETILHLPLAAVRAGIAQSLLKCTSRIGSLRYCEGAIEENFEKGSAENGYSIYLETVLLREGLWNPKLKPLDAAAMEATIRRRGLTQQNLPGAGGDVVELRPGQTERDPE
jgi:hypothetical protein